MVFETYCKIMFPKDYTSFQCHKWYPDELISLVLSKFWVLLRYFQWFNTWKILSNAYFKMYSSNYQVNDSPCIWILLPPLVIYHTTILFSISVSEPVFHVYLCNSCAIMNSLHIYDQVSGMSWPYVVSIQYQPCS